MNTRITEKIDSLYDAVRGKDELNRAYRYNDKLLQENGIRLSPHDFSKPAQNIQPMMFFTRYGHFSQAYPIRMGAFDSSKRKDQLLHYSNFEPGGKFMSPMSRTAYATNYLLEWTVGGQIPRKLPAGSMDLLLSRGINEVCEPHYLLSGDYRWDIGNRHGWTSTIFEYTKGHPHVVILSTQFNAVVDGSILHGELELILSAMKARAKQPLQEGEDDGINLLFGLEERFPVLMISMVAPSHGRILHACMNGDELLIRKGNLVSFERKNVDTLNLFSSWLLSSPNSEPGFITPQSNLPMRGPPVG